MWFSLLKLIALSAIILLLGQVRVGSATVGEHYFRAVSHVLETGGKEFKESKIYANLANLSVVKNWLYNVYPPAVIKAPALPAEENEKDDPTDSDRESVLKLLD